MDSGNAQQVLIAELLDVLQSHAGIGARMRAQVVQTARKIRFAGALVEEAGKDLGQVVLSQVDLSDCAALVLRAALERSTPELAQLVQAADQVGAMAAENTALIDDARNAILLLRDAAATMTRIADVLELDAPPAWQPPTVQHKLEDQLPR